MVHLHRLDQHHLLPGHDAVTCGRRRSETIVPCIGASTIVFPIRPTVAGATEYGCCCERSTMRDRRWPGAPLVDHQPRQGLLHGPRRHQARPRQLLPPHRRRGDARDGRPAGAAAALPQRRRTDRRSSRSGSPTARPDWLHTTIVRRRTAPRRVRWSSPTSPTSCGPSTSAASASTPGRRTRPTSSTATSCASTSTPVRAPTSRWRRRPRRRRSSCSTSSASARLHQDDRQPRPARVRATRATARQRRGARRGSRRRARARAPSPRPDHRLVVEGGPRRADLHRLQPERSAQDGVRAVVGAGARSRAGVVPRSHGTSCRRAIHHDTDHRNRAARLGCRAWRPVGRHGRITAVARAVARDGPCATRRPACPTHRGRPCTRRWPASRRVSRRAVPRSPRHRER